MSINRKFFQELRLTGIAHIELSDENSIPALTQKELETWNHAATLACPLEPPTLNAEAASWAARVFYILCKFIADRRSALEEINELIYQQPEPTNTDSNTWSVDLFFRQLNHIHKITERMSSNDPLLTTIEELATKWPLSSPGIKKIQCAPNTFSHPALLELYIERIINTGDHSKINDVAIKQRIMNHIGIAPTVQPKLRNHLKEEIV